MAHFLESTFYQVSHLALQITPKDSNKTFKHKGRGIGSTQHHPVKSSRAKSLYRIIFAAFVLYKIILQRFLNKISKTPLLIFYCFHITTNIKQHKFIISVYIAQKSGGLGWVFCLGFLQGQKSRCPQGCAPRWKF